MTCCIASADRAFAAELHSLCLLANLTVTVGRADLLLLDLDCPATAPVCDDTLRFSRSAEAQADFYRPFSYGAFLDEMSVRSGRPRSDRRTLAYAFPEETAFTATEKRLLDALIQASGQTVTCKELALSVFGNEENLNELKVYIRHLRQKIEEPQGVRVIETVRGEGYRLRQDRIGKPRRDLKNGEG